MKQVKDFIIVDNTKIGSTYCKMRLAPADGSYLPSMLPGQFVEVAVNTPGVLLRRPISINDVDQRNNILTLLVRNAGRGTSALMDMKSGETLNLLLPLGNGFSMEAPAGAKMLLIGGGVGVAPLLYLGKKLKEAGFKPEFLLGTRSAADLLSIEEFKEVGTVHVCTEDGSEGVKGFVTAHPVLEGGFHRYYCCGPAPMMKAVAKVAWKNNVDCEVSLENMMACGLGACLCCVEKTVKGNVCVCTEGPVFNINKLTWD
ncbi:MAG: dihydroorotate dehydrogenase electron transfer subunit [Staphylococcus sp.]|nr:dihydroorotate dehydrogenase electron transfer subunit [Staphylococcus sp.]